MDKWRNKMQRFMIGRYGSDALGRFMIGLVFVLIIVNIFVRSNILYVFGLLLLAVCYWRIFSRNVNKRYRENQIYLSYEQMVTGWGRKQKRTAMERKNYHIYRCPSCRQKIRVPRGKGKISIHCPKCHTDFIRRS